MAVYLCKSAAERVCGSVSCVSKVQVELQAEV